MMISGRDIEFLAGHPRGVLHVGAHEGEEALEYSKRGWGPVTWVEMLPEKAALLRAKFTNDPSNTVIEAACWSSETDRSIHRASNNGQSSSLLAPLEHLNLHPEVEFSGSLETVRTKRLDHLLSADASFGFVSVDTQGAEIEVLKGLGVLLDQVQCALVEVNEVEHYSGCPRVRDVDAFFAERGFVRALRVMNEHCGWGDALYIRVSDRPDEVVRRARRRSRLVHTLKRLARPKDVPPWDNWS